MNTYNNKLSGISGNKTTRPIFGFNEKVSDLKRFRYTDPKILVSKRNREMEQARRLQIVQSVPQRSRDWKKATLISSVI